MVEFETYDDEKEAFYLFKQSKYLIDRVEIYLPCFAAAETKWQRALSMFNQTPRALTFVKWDKIERISKAIRKNKEKKVYINEMSHGFTKHFVKLLEVSGNVFQTQSGTLVTIDFMNEDIWILSLFHMLQKIEKFLG